MWQNYQIFEQFPSPDEEVLMNFPLFSTQKYLQLVTSDSVLPVCIRDSQGELLSFWFFDQADENYTCPVSAPYFTPVVKAEESLIVHVDLLLKYLKNNNKKRIEITFDPQFPYANLSALLGIGFGIRGISAVHHLSVQPDDFGSRISKRRKARRLRELQAGKLQVKEIGSAEWSEHYELQAGWRHQMGHRGILSVEKMTNLKQAFETRYFGFKVQDGHHVLAMVFAVWCKGSCLYVYSLISNPHFKSREPSLLLWHTLYEKAGQLGCTVLDLGACMQQDSKIKKGLAAYKSSIGATLVKKYQLSW